MAGDIKIRLVSELFPKGFKEAEAGLKDIEAKYKQATNKTLAEAKGSIPKMTKAYKAIFESGIKDAPKLAGEYFKNWANALIYNFSGGDASKLKTQLQKAIAEITNIGGEDNLAFIGMTEINKNLKEVAQLYDEASTGVESASRRKQVMYEKEMAVLKQLGLEEEAYNLTMKHTKEQMLALSPTMENYTAEMDRLSKEYIEAKTNLEKLTAEQNKGKSSVLNYLGSIGKSMIAHQALASAVRAVRTTLREATQASAEAEQRFNKLATVFEGIEDKARRMADELATSLGVATSTSASALSTVGDLLQAQGMGIEQSLEVAKDWVSKFADIIAFKDIDKDLSTLASDLMAGFLGNTRNLRSIGVIVKDSAVKIELARRNLDKLTGSELELAKMNIRAEMTFNQLQNAIGATKREWDTNLAVNRRLNEAWKEYRENLGESINSVLKPIKNAWAGILEQINKANKAQELYAQGAKEMNVYDIKNNEKDYNKFSSVISSNVKTLNKASGDIEFFTAQKELDKALIMYSATVEDLVDVLKELKIEIKDEAVMKNLRLWEEQRQAELKLAEEIDARYQQLLNANESRDKFIESLFGITGVGFSYGGYTEEGLKANAKSATATNLTLSALTGSMTDLVASALKSINEADLASTWGDVIAGALDELDTPGLLEARMNSLRQLFTEAWNQFNVDGEITNLERDRLNEIKKSYHEAIEAIDAYNAELERQKNVQSQLESLQSSANSYQTQFEQLGMSEDAKALDDLQRSFNDFKSTLQLEEEESKKLEETFKNQVEWLTKLQKAQAEAERKEKARNAILERQNAIQDTFTQIAQLRMSEEEKAVDNLRLAYEKQKAELDLTADEASELYRAYLEQRDILIQLQKLTKEYNDELEKREKRESTLNDYISQNNDYRTQLSNVGLTDAEITRRDLGLALTDARNADDLELVDYIEGVIESFELLQTALAEVERADRMKEVVNQFDGMAYATQIATIGMTENQKALWELNHSYEEAKKNTELNDEELKQLTANYEAQRDALVTLQDLTQKYNDELEREALIKSHTDKTADYRTQLANLGLTSNEIYRNGLVASLNDTSLDYELRHSIYEEIVAFDELQKVTKELADAEAKAKAVQEGWDTLKSNAISSMGTVGSAITTFTDGKGDIWSDILTVLLDIAKQSEYFEDVVNIINMVIQPILPLVGIVAYTLKNLEPVFISIASIIGTVSMVVASIFGAVNYIIDFFQWGWDWLKTAFHNLGEIIIHPINKSARDIEKLPSLYDYTKETTENLGKTYDEILHSLDNIDKNTAQDNSKMLEAYNNMLKAQLITGSEYDALVANMNGVRYDRARSYNGTSWMNGTGGTTIVYSGDMKFTIEGTNLSADEIADAVIRKQQMWASTGHYH